MKKTMFLGTLVSAVLSSLLAGPAPFARAHPDQAMIISAANQAATSPWTIGWVDANTSTRVGGYPSVAYNPSDNLPYITYYDAVNGNFMLSNPGWVGGLNCGTDNDWWCRVVDSNGNVGTYSSIAF